MKFSIGSLIQIDTEDKYHPVVFNDTLVDIFFGLTAALHGLQAYRYKASPFWVGVHGVAAALSAYWPYMIHMGYTHKGLGHASYGLLSLVPHLTAVQVFGALMTLDKIINLNDLSWPLGGKVFPWTKPINSYGVDNMLLDNATIPKGIQGLAVNIPFIAIASAAEWIALGSARRDIAHMVSHACIAAGLITASEDWVARQDPGKKKSTQQ
jgi:hypothetical protein